MNLCSATAKFCGDVFWQSFGIAAGYINIKIFICLEFIQHIIDSDFNAAVFLVHYFCGKLHFVYKQVELLILPVADDAFHILAQSDRIPEFIIAPLIQFNFQDVVLRNILRKEILEKKVKKQYGLSTSAYACDNLYLAVPHTMNQSIHISISINHSLHLVLRTKLSELLCIAYHDFWKISSRVEKFTKKLRQKRTKYEMNCIDTAQIPSGIISSI